MAFTSQWVLNDVKRGVDISTSGSAIISRDAWSVRRSRHSDDAYSSLQGTTATSLSGENGGVTETVTAPDMIGFRFATTRNWVSNDAIWVKTGTIVNNNPVYIQNIGTTNIPDGDYVNALWITWYDDGYRYRYRWTCSETTMDNVLSGSIGERLNCAAEGWATHIPAALPLPKRSLNGRNFHTASGTFVGASVISENETGTGYFYCESDVQNYTTASVDWYKQEQFWTFVGAYK